MLEELRKNSGLSKIFVAKKIQMHRDRLTRIEEGKADLPARCVPILSKLYGVSELEIISVHRKDYVNGKDRKGTNKIM